MSGYAIISLGGKQYRVQEGERLLVDRLREDEGATLQPRVLLVGGNGAPDLTPSTTVTARVVGHELGEKIRIGKYRRRTGYKKHAGHRSRLTRIEIESIGAKAGSTAGKAAGVQPKDRAPAGAPGRGKTSTEKPKAEPKPAAKAEKAAATGPDVEAMTIPQITEALACWSRAEIEAALEQERAGKARKGALAALESALEEEH
jgi:large subunit ribosomal protein L21